ncbi:Kae1-associated serine/threonine protein kinase [Candidatus Woesearchaeota archaeon]|nr:Kae1-associated serine/threonine protein kinase [Candidatus Woesearchaeota archaeon]
MECKVKIFLHEGAEAKIYFSDGTVIKERLSKDYRHKDLDMSIRKKNTRKEAKLLQKAGEYIPVPKVLGHSDKEMVIQMEFIEGKKLRDVIESIDRKNIFTRVGRKIAKLHNASIIHGDLTTSNILIHDKVYFIDFGLGFISTKIEDKAVDLHIIKKALESKHYTHAEECFTYLLEGYTEENKETEAILRRLDKVEKRGHYKQK